MPSSKGDGVVQQHSARAREGCGNYTRFAVADAAGGNIVYDNGTFVAARGTATKRSSLNLNAAIAAAAVSETPRTCCQHAERGASSKATKLKTPTMCVGALLSDSLLRTAQVHCDKSKLLESLIENSKCYAL